MKFLNLIVIYVALFFSTGVYAQTKEITVRTKIYCDHCNKCETCKDRIEKELKFSKGIKSIKLDTQAMTITVGYNPKKTNEQQIKEAIANAGYDADEVKASPKAYDKLDECCKKK